MPEGVCNHQEHNDACGFKEAQEGSPCNFKHVHDKTCGGEVDNPGEPALPAAPDKPQKAPPTGAESEVVTVINNIVDPTFDQRDTRRFEFTLTPTWVPDNNEPTLDAEGNPVLIPDAIQEAKVRLGAGEQMDVYVGGPGRDVKVELTGIVYKDANGSEQVRPFNEPSGPNKT
ncbi:MAG: hypothetical protein RR495_04195 [Anaerovoracaceae bacterium]